MFSPVLEAEPGTLPPPAVAHPGSALGVFAAGLGEASVP
jgi:hypothetical protein